MAAEGAEALLLDLELVATTLRQPPSQLSYAEFCALEKVYSDQWRMVRPIGNAFCTILNTALASAAAAAEDPPPPPWSLEQLIDSSAKPACQLRVAAQFYVLQCAGSKGEGSGQEAEEFQWRLTDHSSRDQCVMTQLTLCTPVDSTVLRDALAPALHWVAAEFGYCMVSAGRTSIEMATSGQMDKTTAGAVSSAWLHGSSARLTFSCCSSSARLTCAYNRGWTRCGVQCNTYNAVCGGGGVLCCVVHLQLLTRSLAAADSFTCSC